MTTIDAARIGTLIRDARKLHGWTQAHLADKIGTSQSAVNRIEKGGQNLSLDTVRRISEALDAELLTLGRSDVMHLRVHGGRELSGAVDIRSSKNAAVALLCASLLNRGRTTLRGVARIAEVDRILEVLRSIGVSAEWTEDGRDLVLQPPATLALDEMDQEAARRTRSILMLLGPLVHDRPTFTLPYAGGCDLGTRTVEPHMLALRHFGVEVRATEEQYHVDVDRDRQADGAIVLVERGDTVTENAILAAARHDGVTTIRNASPNYMVQDLCFFLEDLGVKIEGVGTTTLVVHGVPVIDTDIEYAPSEDPVEAMTFLAAAIVTKSSITIRRVPIEFVEIELAILRTMGFRYDMTAEYMSTNGRTRLVDITTHVSELKAPIDKIHAMPFPGVNIDNLPFFAVIAASAEGGTMIHDWTYDNRAIYLTELTNLGANVRLLDPHRVLVEGPTRWRGAELMCPPALRPAVVVLLGMLAAQGTSVLRNVYMIRRGYEDLADRLTALGAQITVFRDM
ncbi:UDP-N-acetylglucosamine 1-carboxyvinyltransferase [Sanguibacter keddieii DSM 10542]|uniref:UDP-N-acetylglucosamine 1-carboxyvinyltransferase n=1 Tax=Sanguibacter keddieii (strain ATCC 51767 / DSM 10542 / NCFB 3025 / ST-74) TaxID=446469 RepID=D1BEJ2_SANKS|nr:UDP-N-acetylglucosamine 1-carboxyvinyltransferase [Sanguibacter keddieii]ACZ21270.1 UDP-N-acetylglucosamine 1-carboxyvinyltransferase [Sanguibacter keddieii DSM 10542]